MKTDQRIVAALHAELWQSTQTAMSLSAELPHLQAQPIIRQLTRLLEVLAAKGITVPPLPVQASEIMTFIEGRWIGRTPDGKRIAVSHQQWLHTAEILEDNHIPYSPTYWARLVGRVEGVQYEER